MKRIVILALFTIFFLGFNVFIQAQETITISTYYPAPSGVYQNLRLFPSATQLPANCNLNTEGTLYYDNKTNQILACRKTEIMPDVFTWQQLSLWTLAGVAPNQLLHHQF